MALKFLLALALLFLVAWAGVAMFRRPPKLPEDLQGAVDTAVSHYKLPGLAACVVTINQIEIAVAGRQELGPAGPPRPVKADHYWHIGSNSKAITATLAAILYERGLLKPEDKIAVAFDFPLHADYADITLIDLLQHRSGLAPFTAGVEFDPYEEKVSKGSPRQQRLAFTKLLLTAAAPGERGEYEYSNAGYSVAAAYIEARTDRSWEELLETELFKPLGMRVRVGWPATAKDPLQPLGHWDEGTGLTPLDIGHEYELPAALDPAGDLSMPIEDYGKFLQLHLRGLRGLTTEVGTGDQRRVLLKPETIKELHEPNGDYSCGWIELRILSVNEASHDGSTGTFYMTATIGVDSGVAVAAVTNAGNSAAERAVHAVANRMKSVASARIARGKTGL